MVPEGSIVRTTLRALLEPKRLLPILAVCAPMVWAQHAYSRDRHAVLLGVLMCAAFVTVAPVSWRVLFPEGLEFSHGAVRLALYAAVGAGTVLSVGAAIPKVFAMDATFLTERHSLLISVALFGVGGWGLGRDIGMEERLQAFAREAELAQLLALRSHLDPHFLFNTLNAIAEWCRQDPEVSERAVLQLSSILRTVLDGVRTPAWPLEKELELVRTLFSLHLLRDPALFKLAMAVPEGVGAIAVPPMVLLPLAENAVKHGPAAGHRGEIALSAERRDGNVCIALENPGPYRGPREGSTGVPTVQKRLALAYDGRASLTLERRGERTCARLVLPADGPAPGVLT